MGSSGNGSYSSYNANATVNSRQVRDVSVSDAGVASKLEALLSEFKNSKQSQEKLFSELFQSQSEQNKKFMDTTIEAIKTFTKPIADSQKSSTETLETTLKAMNQLISSRSRGTQSNEAKAQNPEAFKEQNNQAQQTQSTRWEDQYNPDNYRTASNRSNTPNKDSASAERLAFNAQGNSNASDVSQIIQNNLKDSQAKVAAQAQKGGSDSDASSSSKKVQDKTQDEIAAELQGNLKKSATTLVIVEVLKKISSILSDGLSKVEKFNDDLRRVYHTNGETSTKIMDATFGARSAVKESLGIQISTDDSIKAIKEQILNNGVNAAHLNKSTQEMAVGLSKFGMKLDKNTLMSIDQMNLTQGQQKVMLDQFMAMSSGENTFRADINALGKDFKSVMSLAVTQGKSNEETSKMIAGYSKEVQKLMAMGINQQSAQQMAMNDLSRDTLGYDKRATSEEWKRIVQIAGLSDATASSAEVVKEARRAIQENSKDREALKEMYLNLQMKAQKGDEKSNDMILTLNNILNGREGHMVEAGSEEAKSGYGVPWLERMKGRVTSAIGDMSTGLVSSMWGIAGQGTLQDTVKKGFELVIAGMTANSLKDAFGSMFPKLSDIFTKSGSSAAKAAEMAGKAAVNTGNVAGSLKGGLSNVTGLLKSGLTAIKAVAGPVAAIAGVLVAIAAVVKGIKAFCDGREKDKNAEKELAQVTRELQDAKIKAELARGRGNTSEAAKLDARVQELSRKQDEMAGNRIDARKERNEGVGKAAGAGGGALAGAAIGAALGSVIPGLGTAVGAGIGAGVGALAGYFGGGAIGSAVSDDNNEATRNAIMSSANKGRDYYNNSNGSIVDKDIITHVGEGGKVEVILPATKPHRMIELSAQMAKRNDVSDDVRDAFDVMHKSLSSNVKHNEDGSIVDKETVTHVGEGNNPEVILPTNKPHRMIELSAEAAKRSDMSPEVKDSFTAMNNSLTGKGGELSDSEKDLINQMIAFAKGNAGKRYQLHGRKDPDTGQVWDGFVCNQLVSNAFKAIGDRDKFSRFSYGVKSILLGHKKYKGLLEDDDWVNVAYEDIKPGMIVFTGMKEFPTHVGIADEDHKYWNASGGAKLYDTPRNFKDTLQSDNGVRLSKIDPKRFKYAGYFRSMFGDYANAKPVELKTPDPMDNMGDVQVTSQSQVQVNAKTPSSPVKGTEASTSVKRSLFDMLNAMNGLKASSKLLNRNGFLHKALVQGIIGGKAESLYTNETLRRLLEHNMVDESQSRDASIIGYNPLRMMRFGDTIPATFGSLEEGFEDYLSSIERYFGALSNMNGMQQFAYLQNSGVINSQVAHFVEMSKAMSDLSKELNELKQEVREQNTAKKINDMRNVNMPMRPMSMAY